MKIIVRHLGSVYYQPAVEILTVISFFFFNKYEYELQYNTTTNCSFSFIFEMYIKNFWRLFGGILGLRLQLNHGLIMGIFNKYESKYLDLVPSFCSTSSVISGKHSNWKARVCSLDRLCWIVGWLDCSGRSVPSQFVMTLKHHIIIFIFTKHSDALILCWRGEQ